MTVFDELGRRRSWSVESYWSRIHLEKISKTKNFSLDSRPLSREISMLFVSQSRSGEEKNEENIPCGKGILPSSPLLT
jgi:hypothetical protein